MEKVLLEKALAFVSQVFAGDASGHDRDHTLRVYRLAMEIGEREGGDLDVIALGALLHDVDDHKLSPETCEGKTRARAFLDEAGVPAGQQERIIRVIGEVSFQGEDSVRSGTSEGRAVQDADRLDAMGAIGIARAFAFGGAHGRKLYDPEEKPRMGMSGEEYRSHVPCTLNHFYEKLLKLEGLMNTGYAKALARERHAFMEEFLERFIREWEGKA